MIISPFIVSPVVRIKLICLCMDQERLAWTSVIYMHLSLSQTRVPVFLPHLCVLYMMLPVLMTASFSLIIPNWCLCFIPDSA
jgi:hypothetical protein